MGIDYRCMIGQGVRLSLEAVERAPRNVSWRLEDEAKDRVILVDIYYEEPYVDMSGHAVPLPALPPPKTRAEVMDAVLALVVRDPQDLEPTRQVLEAHAEVGVFLVMYAW
jgi:hypothetical protein